MFWSVNIGSIAGTAVRIHITFLLFLVWIFAAGWASGGPQAAIGSLVFMVLLFACVLAHEFGHIFAARAFGVATPDVTLLPIGGVARMERIPEKPSEEFLIAIAGPLVNIAIALVLMAFMQAHFDTQTLAAVERTNVSLVDRLAEVNLFLALFNLIPAFPMDGGRVLRALLATKLGYVRATEVAATIVATRAGGTPDLTGEDGGLLVPPDDPAALTAAVRQVLGDPALAGRLAQAARDRAAALPTVNAAVDAALAIYRELSGQPAAPDTADA